MKYSILFVASAIISCFAMECQSQLIDVKKTAENVVLNQTNQAINNGINRGVSAIFNAPGKIYRKIKDKQQQPANTYPSDNNNSMGNVTNNNSTANYNTPDVTVSGLGTIYGTDFTAGNTVLWSENFSASTTGKFPEHWTTTSAGEVRVVENSKWLQLSTNGLFAPETLKSFPGNFTFEFDAIFNQTATNDAHYIVYLYSTKDKATDFKETNYPGRAGVYFAFNTKNGEVDAESFEDGKVSLLDFHLITDVLKSTVSNKIHIGLRKEGAKVSLYFNGYEVFSSAQVLTNNYTYDAIKFGSFYMSKDDFMLLSNLKIASN